MRAWIGRFSLSMIGVALCVAVEAQTPISVPPDTFRVQAGETSYDPSSPCYNNGENGIFTPTCTVINFAPVNASFPPYATATISPGINPILNVTTNGVISNAPTSATVYGFANSAETIYFAINPGPGTGNGPAPTEVPVDLSAEGSVIGNNADWTVYLSGDDVEAGCSQAVGATCNQTVMLPIGYLYSLELAVGANASGTTPGATTAAAGLDPVIAIDPAFLAANPGYSLEFGAGTFPVPLPGTAWLMGSALALLGAIAAISRGRSLPAAA